jgi:hypothetical protein
MVSLNILDEVERKLKEIIYQGLHDTNSTNIKLQKVEIIEYCLIGLSK